MAIYIGRRRFASIRYHHDALNELLSALLTLPVRGNEG
jgi:hypothetical protein